MPPVPKPKRKRQRTFLKEWREFRKLSQEQVAARMNISRENYGRIEAMKIPYNQDTLELAAYALRCTASDLLERDPNLESEVDKLRRVLAEASPEQQKRIIRVAKSLLENND